MKILICLYSINNYGGITTYVEHLNRGLASIGHEAELMLLSETDRKPYNRRHSKRPGNFPSSWEKFTANSDTGWGGVPVWSYANSERIAEFRRHVNKTYDAVIWGVPVPSWSKLKLVPDWQELYKLKVPQIAIIHDGNFRYLYPHLNAVASRLQGVACVHGAAFTSAQMFDGAYSLIPNPHPLLKSTTEWDDRKRLIACAHMWKGWKHMEIAVKAVPLLKSSRMILAGDGIERRYMCSPTKCPPKYEGIWPAMMESGKAKWLDVLSQQEMRELYLKSRIMFDPSYSKNYNLMGSHFNRSVFEAYNSGMVPVCMESNMQIPELFKNGKTHVGIPAGSSIKKIASILDDAANMSAEEAGKIVVAGRAIIKKHFHRDVVAQGLLNLLDGESPGILGVHIGKPTKRMRAATQNILDGGRPRDRVLPSTNQP